MDHTTTPTRTLPPYTLPVLPPAKLAQRRYPRPPAKTHEPKRNRSQRQRKFVSAITHQPILEMHFPDGDRHFDDERGCEEARKQSKHNGDSAEKFGRRGKICQPLWKAERAHEIHVMMKPAPYLVITMRDHDRSQNEPHDEQREGLQPVEKIHVYLQNSRTHFQNGKRIR